MEKLLCGDNKQRNIHIWEPEKPSMVFLTVHGGMDHGGNYVILALYFRDHGIATVAHDMQGHDHHGPDHPTRVIISRFDVFLDDLDRMLDWVKQSYPGLPIFFLAHSMGSLVVTHYGIRRLGDDPDIKGFILSSPYYVNAIKTPPIMVKLAGILSAIAPRMKLPIESFLDQVTRDKEIYQRHLKDEADGIMAKESSMRFGAELLKAQAWIPDHIGSLDRPVLMIVAGDDRLADAGATRSLLKKIRPELLTELYYPENMHENFNELNREEIFGEILRWVEEREGAGA